MAKWGSWAFLVGLLVVVVFSFISPADWVPMVLVILGLVVGFWNVTEKENHSFLLAVVALLLFGTGGLEALPVVGYYLSPFFANLTAFIAPSALVVAVKTVMDTAKKG